MEMKYCCSVYESSTGWIVKLLQLKINLSLKAFVLPNVINSNSSLYY